MLYASHAKCKLPLTPSSPNLLNLRISRLRYNYHNHIEEVFAVFIFLCYSSVTPLLLLVVLLHSSLLPTVPQIPPTIMNLHSLLLDLHKSDAGKPFPVSKKEFMEHVDTLTQKIDEYYRSLVNIVDRHEDTIRKRWRKKKTKDREAILLRAWKDISKEHRPDLAPDSTPSGSYISCNWPYLNLEDLKQPEPLLILLNARARNAPHTFALRELLFSPFARMKKVVLYRRLPNATMLFTDPVRYGKIRFFGPQDHPEAAQRAEAAGAGLHPGEGLQVLEIQARIYGGLLECCKLILHDYVKDKTTLDNNVHPVKPEPTDSFHHGENQASFADTVMLEPYQPRGGFDIDRLQHLIASLLENSKDEAWALREDPSYFAEYVNGLTEHRPEMVADANGKIPGATTKVKAFVLSGMVQEKSYMLIIADHLSLIVERAVKLSKEYPNGVYSGDGSPNAYFDALQDIRFVLETLQARLAKIVETSLSGSSLMRRHVMRVDVSSQGSNVIAALAAKDSLNQRNTPLGWQIYNYLKRIGACGRQNGLLLPRLDALESIRRHNPSSKDWISLRTDWGLTQLSIVAECLRLFLAQPWATRMTFSINSNGQELAKKLAKLFFSWIALIEDNFEGIASPILGDPADGKFDYPVNKARNEKNVNLMREAEANLDAFWNYVDRNVKAKTGSGQHEVIERIFDTCGHMRRTVPWVALKRQQKPSGPEAKSAGVEELPYSTIFHDNTKEITGPLKKLTIPDKVKEKTKGVANPPAPGPAEPEEETPVQEFSSFEANKKDASVWRALFYQTDNSNDVPGKVKWSDFKSALCNLQFSARHLHGSAWEFTPRGDNMPEGNGRPIQFHEPHPDSSIPFILARRFGRRLARAYGLKGEMFKRKET